MKAVINRTKEGVTINAVRITTKEEMDRLIKQLSEFHIEENYPMQKRILSKKEYTVPHVNVEHGYETMIIS